MFQWMKQRLFGWAEAQQRRESRMIFFGEASLRAAVREYIAHYHGERNHQGLSNRLIDPGEHVGQTDGDVECHERLGGLLHYYHRTAA